MENKYYTPSTDEFHVGFEFEYLRNEVWYEDEINDLEHSHIVWKDHESERRPVRVKYLDREDIESLGFKQSGMRGSEDLFLGKKVNDPIIGEYSWVINFNPKQTAIAKVSSSGGMIGDCFRGTIKNKSELKRILKQIGYEG